MRMSESRAGDCQDSAVKESFFGTPKKETARNRRRRTREDARRAILDYIEVFHIKGRLHSSLGRPALWSARGI